MNDDFWGDAVTVIEYTDEQAVEDGIKFKLDEGLYITTNLAGKIYPDYETSIVPLVLRVKMGVLAHYNNGVYAFPASADPHNEADKYFAYYIVNGVKVWAILDGGGLHLIAPEDY